MQLINNKPIVNVYCMEIYEVIHALTKSFKLHQYHINFGGNFSPDCSDGKHPLILTFGRP
jgi:hypothetical protein